MPDTSKRFGQLYFRSIPQIRTTAAGWIGAKAGLGGDIVTIDANGKIDQIVAAGNPITNATGRIGYLNNGVTASVAAGTEEALKTQIGLFDDATEIELQACNGTSATATAATMVGKQYAGRRLANGNYVVDTAATANPIWEVIRISPRYGIAEVGGTLIVKAITSVRIQ